MAGQPKRRAMLAALERRTRALYEDAEAPQATHLDYVCEWVASGKTMLALSAALIQDAGIEWPDAMLGNYLRGQWGEEATRALDAAREIGAHALAESSVTVADEAVGSKEDAARARNRIGARQWLAGAWSPRFRPSSGGNVTVNLDAGALMLDALRARARSLSTETTTSVVDRPPDAPRITATSRLTRVAGAQPVAPQEVADLL
jgi:hypothetical protein